MILLLLKPKLLLLKNSINTQVVLRRLPFIAIGIVFWLLFYIGTYKVLTYVRGIEFFGEILSRKLFSMTFFSLFGFLILSSIITAISFFYLSKDIPLLLSKPVEIRDILRVKTFEAFMNSSWMALSFMPPVFIAYGISYGAAAGYYLLVLACFLLFSLITAGIGITIAHILTRVFPAKRTRNVLLGIGVMLFIMIYFLVKGLIPQDISTPEGFINSIMSFKTESPMLPSFWITEAVFPILKKSSFNIFYPIIILSNALFFLLLSEIAGLRFYRVNMERIQPSSERVKRGILGGYYPEINTAMFYKDIKIFFRDTGQWSQVFIIGALIMIYIYNFKSIPINALSGFPFIKEIMVLVNLVLSGLVLSAVSARFIYASVSLEGQAFWIIRTSPVDINRFIRSKFFYGFIPVTLLMLVLVFLTNFVMDAKRILMYLSLGTVLMLCVSVSGLGTGFGAMYPKFKHENIAAVSMSLGGMAFMLIAFSVVIATLSLEAWIFYVYNLKEAMDMSGAIQIVLCMVMIILINTTAFYLPLRIGRKKLQEHIGII
ncbi:MAG: hypothetical protein A2Z09_06305 [Nitrospirae bacterium RBG_16_43_8]|nr:MAG: hypothetical protein A2Z09_06305 [Nitrospirae bacterium RBG_16_43_8]